MFQKHQPMSQELYVKVKENIPLELLEQFEIPTSPIKYRGSAGEEEVAKRFIETVVNIARKVEKLLKTNNPIVMTTDTVNYT